MTVSETNTQGRPSLKERQRELRESAILDSTRELLISKGYLAMTLEDVIAHVGISKPTLYQHFRSKEDLVLNVVLRKAREVRTFISELGTEGKASERLEKLTRWVVEKRFQRPALRIREFIHHIKPLDGSESPCLLMLKGLDDDVFMIVMDGQEDGSIRKDIPAAVLAQTLMSAIRDDGYDTLLREGKLTLEELTYGLIRLMQPLE